LRRDSGISTTGVLSVLLAAAILVAALGFVEDVMNTRDYGGVDLRNRVVGARVMLEGLDPYHFKWSGEYPDTLLDPVDNPANEVSRVTVPPSLLMLHMPFAGLSYSVQRTMWLCAQWLLLLASLLLFSRCARSRDQALAIWIIWLFIAATPIWRFHVERGQIYILFVFLAALSFWLSRRPWRYAALWGGAVLGAAASMRPTLALVLLPLLFFRKWKLAAGLAAGLAFFLLLSVLISGVPVWKDYAGAMRHHEKDNLGLAQPESLERGYGLIEGMDNLREFMPFPHINTSLQWKIKEVFGADVRSGALFVMLGAVLLLAAAFLWWFRGRRVTLEAAYLAGFSIVLVCEFFIPAIKAWYANIMWIVPFSLVVLAAGEARLLPARQQAMGLFLLSAGALLAFSAFWLDYDALLGEGLITLFFVWTGACLVKASPCRDLEAGSPPERLREAAAAAGGAASEGGRVDSP
jgi:hypothetical protein